MKTENFVGNVDTFTTATDSWVAPVNASQLSVGVNVLTVVPGGDEPP